MSGSALLGQPPSTQNDFWIAKGMLMARGMLKADPSKGVRVQPSRPPPDLYRFESKATGIVVGMVVSIIIMLAVTITRLMIRYMKPNLKWGYDDWLIMPGVILAVAWPASQIARVQYGGAGKHIYDVTYEEYAVFNWIGMTSKLIFFVAVGIVKMSIVMFNMRLTGLTSNRWMIAHWTFFGLLVAYTLTSFFLNIFQCNPPRASFDAVAAGKLDGPAKCLSNSFIGTILSIAHVAMDFCLLAVPIIILWKMKRMSLSTKIRLYIVFSVGAMSCIGSVLRQLAQAKIGPDPTYTFTDILTWTLVDLTCGVTAASLPVLSALIPRNPFIWTRSNWSGSRDKNYTPGSGSLGRTALSSDKYQGGSDFQTTPDMHSKGDSQDGIVRENDRDLQYTPNSEMAERGLVQNSHLPGHGDGK